MMDLTERYIDCDQKPRNILWMCKYEPEWAANRVQVGETAIAHIAELEAQLATERDKWHAERAQWNERVITVDHENEALKRQLDDMTKDRDSESRWAKFYSDQVLVLEQKMLALERKRERMAKELSAAQ